MSTTFFHISTSYSHNAAVGPVIPALFIRISIFEFSVILLVSGCGSVKQTRQFINKGNYDNAINIAVKKLQNNKSKKGNQPYIVMLKEAFDKAVIEDNEKNALVSKGHTINVKEKLLGNYGPISTIYKNQSGDFVGVPDIRVGTEKTFNNS